jgi:uncharacterized lipoprotein YddW (UPF0748 family)
MKRKILLFIFSSFCFISYSQQAPLVQMRGTWITNVASNAMLTPENVKASVANCKRNGLTDIFVVVWNNGLTMYPSEVLKKHIGVAQDPVYKGFDPIKAYVEEGHKAGLRVHAWFEFGAAYAYKDSSLNNWLAKYPHWAGRNKKGTLLKKNEFYWWNAMHPEVQIFLTELILEVVKKYAVDGVQGDDRLPAMPGEGGYDDYSVNLYKQQHNGLTPPTNEKDTEFIQWKANQLSAFGKNIYQAVKKQRANCWVTWAPSIYPWSKEQYLQDWPAWMNGGYADYILPQLYRYNLTAYEKILKELSNQVPPALKKRVFPGVLTSLGDGYRVDPALLEQMIQLNRANGFDGEVFFYYETIKEARTPIYK